MELVPRLIDVRGNVVPAEMAVSVTAHAGGERVALTVTPTETLRAARLVVDLDVRVSTVLEHGLQSWSTVRRCRPDDVRPARAAAPRWFTGQMLAERQGAGVEISGDTFLVTDVGVMGFLSARAHFARVAVDSAGRCRAEWLMDGALLVAGQTVELDDLWIGLGDPATAYSTYAQLAGVESRARSPRPQPRVWCSWYQYFDQVTPRDVRENADLAQQHDLEVIQIDDGWQAEIGVWHEVSARFGVSLATLAHEIRDRGLIAGVWTAPFLAIENGRLARERPEWLVTNDRGVPTTALVHEGWGGRVFALDTSRDDVCAHVRATYSRLREQGFDYFKIDFCHAAAAVGARHDPTCTRAVALRRGLEAVREGVGEDAYVVGCGGPLLSAVGVVDAMRVSEDVAPFYEPRQYFDGYRESTVAARNAVEASLLRAPLHDRWFTLDPDCVLMRTTDTELSDNEREIVTLAACASSGFVVLSDRLADYGEAQWDRIRRARQESPGGPRDLVDPFARPLRVRAGGVEFEFDWDARMARRLESSGL